MKTAAKYPLLIAFFLACCAFFPSFIKSSAPAVFPYREAGLSDQQAAAHLLSRFSYGPVPGQVEALAKTGLEKWFMQQLQGNLPDDALERRLQAYDALDLSNSEVVKTFPKAAQVLRMASAEGVINRDSIAKDDRARYKGRLEAYMQQKGLRPQQELFRQFFNQKILRASYTNNQLQEIMTDFWFNHFNVSLTKNACAEFVPAYERDVIRPNVFGKFSDLLLATAKSPAMLIYLDNFNSSGQNDNAPQPTAAALRRRMQQQQQRGISDTSMMAQPAMPVRNNRGLNENYAREVMELHTLGVDGGYTQQDVTEAARVLTGWTVNPMSNGPGGRIVQNAMRAAGDNRMRQAGIIREGDFLFAANRHDSREKSVLGRKFPANGGYDEGVQLLRMLAEHPSAARFISRKIAVRFVSDEPPQALVDRMAATFTRKNGDIREVLLTMVSSPEFWSQDVLREKTKSPFELAISSVRSLNADIRQPYQLFTWVTKMGQKMYYYQAPTGFPDKGQYWINTGSLLNRMNFGLALASGRVPGLVFDLAALNGNREPESAGAALEAYGRLMLPERDLTATIARLTPMLSDPELEKKIGEAAEKASPAGQADMMNEDAVIADGMPADMAKKRPRLQQSAPVPRPGKANSQMLSQVVGVIIGSPEFQRK